MTLTEMLILKGLTKREAEVAEAVADGLRSKEIGEKLFVSEKTIKFHLTHIYRKLGFKSAQRPRLVRMCTAHGVHDELKERLLKTNAENIELKLELNKHRLPSKG